MKNIRNKSINIMVFFTLTALLCTQASAQVKKSDAKKVEPLKFEMIKVEEKNQVTDKNWAMMNARSEGKISLAYPKIVAGSSSSKMDEVNKKITEEMKLMGSCGAAGGNGSAIADVTYASYPLLSLHYRSMQHCPKMPAPASFRGGMTFDVSSGKVLSLDTIFEGGKAKAQKYIQLAKDRFLGNMKAGTSAMDCSKADLPLSFFLTDKGISFTEFYPLQLMELCEGEILISFEEMKKDFPKTSPFLKLLKGHP